MNPDATRQVLLRLLRAEAGPIGEWIDANAFRQLVVDPRRRELERVRVAVVAVQQHDPREADVGERPAHVADELEERVHANMDEAVRAAVVCGEPEGDRRADERAELRRRALRHLERDVDVRPERPVIPVVFGRADGHDHHPAAALQVLAHLQVCHLRHIERARHRYSSPSDVKCWYERRIAAFTSSSDGHGSPLNSISTEYGPE